MNRRGLLTGLLATLAAPAIIRTPGLLMSVRAFRFSVDDSLMLEYSGFEPIYGRSPAMGAMDSYREFNAITRLVLRARPPNRNRLFEVARLV